MNILYQLIVGISLITMVLGSYIFIVLLYDRLDEIYGLSAKISKVTKPIVDVILSIISIAATSLGMLLVAGMLLGLGWLGVIILIFILSLVF